MTPFGVYAMQYAFYDAAGAIDDGAMARQVEACVAAGVHGLAVLGLGTETHKLSLDERRRVMRVAARALDGRLPLAVTAAEPSAAGQSAFVDEAADLGADWAILQPPAAKGAPEDELIGFFGAVADAAPIPIAIQNAPDYLGVGLSDAGLLRLAARHPNFRILKGEGPAIQIHHTIQALGDRLAVLNGRGGLELTDTLRAGCVGVIPAAECADTQARIYNLMAAGDPASQAEADRLYGEILPLITFVMQSIDHFLCYGKRAWARRIGVPVVHDRAPAVRPTEFGLAAIERLARGLAPL